MTDPYFKIFNLKSAIESIGDEIAKYVAAQQNSTAQIAIGTFVGPGPSSSNAGSRIVIALTSILKQNDAKIGAAGICNGGGGASAMVIERI